MVLAKIMDTFVSCCKFPTIYALKKRDFSGNSNIIYRLKGNLPPNRKVKIKFNTANI